MARHLRGDEPARCERRVVAEAEVASAEILAAEIRRFVAVDGVRAVDDRAGVDARILQERGDERLTRAQVPGEFCGAEVAAAFACDDIAGARATIRQAVTGGVAHAVVRGEEPELVAHQVAAGIEAEILPRETGRRAAVRNDALRVRLQRIVVVVAERVAVKLVAARFRDDVDDAAGRAAELRFVAAGLHVDFADELEVELLPLEAVLHVRGVDAVDEVRVLGAGRAIDGDRRLLAVARIRI